MRNVGAAWCFVAPALLVIAVFFFLPVFAALAMSLTDFDIYALADSRNLRLVGLRNYAQLLQTPLFWQAFGNTLYFVAVGVPLSLTVSFGTALLLHSKLVKFRAFFRTALFAPVVTTRVPSGLNAAAVTVRVWANSRPRASPLSASHSRAVASAAAVSTRRPSALNATVVSSPSWPSSTARCSPVATSHSRAVLSAEPVTISRPSEL